MCNVTHQMSRDTLPSTSRDPSRSQGDAGIFSEQFEVERDLTQSLFSNRETLKAVTGALTNILQTTRA